MKIIIKVHKNIKIIYSKLCEKIFKLFKNRLVLNNRIVFRISTALKKNIQALNEQKQTCEWDLQQFLQSDLIKKKSLEIKWFGKSKGFECERMLSKNECALRMGPGIHLLLCKYL